MTLVDINVENLVEILREGSEHIEKMSEAYMDPTAYAEDHRIMGLLEGSANMIETIAKTKGNNV